MVQETWFVFQCIYRSTAEQFPGIAYWVGVSAGLDLLSFSTIVEVIPVLFPLYMQTSELMKQEIQGVSAKLVDRRLQVGHISRSYKMSCHNMFCSCAVLIIGRLLWISVDS